MRDIRRALLEADVSLPVVRRFIESVSEKAVGTDVIRGVSPDQQLVKVVNDELVQLMGGEVSDLSFAKSGPTVILLAGLQGVGKTTVCAKLALYLKKMGKSCMLVAADVYRPAAIDQLNILGKKVIFVSLLDFLEYIELTINACSILFGSSNYTCLNVLVYLILQQKTFEL